MNDPTTVNCRIYVGNLKENTTKLELQNIFTKYGTIRGIMVSRNFGFIQFDSEGSANNAIENENQKMYSGRKITVSKVQKKGGQKPGDKGPTNIGSIPDTGNQITQNNPVTSSNAPEQNANSIPSNINNAPNNINNSNNNNNMGNQSQMQNVGNQQSRQQTWRNRNNNRNNMNNEMNLHTDRERSPFDQRRDSNNDRWNQDNQGGGNFNNFRNNNRNNNMGYKSQMNNPSSNNNMGNMNAMVNIKKENINNSGNSGNSGGFGSNSNNNNNSGNQQTFGFPNDNVKCVLNGGVLRGYVSAREIRAKYPDANDCEIVVLEKHLVDYAEYIESRLKRSSITADLLFPNADLTIGKMLTNISNRGALYAVIIQPQHRENNSVTLNILYGIPAEHRNMPLDDAIALMIRDYEHLRQGESGDVIGDNDESPYASIPLANIRHPDSIQHLINLLADNRTLTVLQLDCIMKYLQERREAQYKFELGDTNINVQQNSGVDNKTNEPESSSSSIKPTVEPPKVNPEEEIQKRIFEILNKPSIPNIKPDTSVDKSPDKKHANTSELSSIVRQEPKLLAKDPNLRNVLDSLMLDDF